MKSRPYVDVLKIGLADASGNACECENCRNKTVSDWYVILLNELDEALTKNGLDVKIAASYYNHTSWPPVTEKINNPDRYLVNAGISTSYIRPLQPEYEKVEIPENILNGPDIPATMDVKFTIIDEWKKQFGDKIIAMPYDCYFIHYADPGHSLLPKRYAEDLKVYPKIKGLMGAISCQTQRIGFPTALHNCIMGEMLINNDTDFEEFSDKYYMSAFGEDGLKVKEYLKKISDGFDPGAISLSGSVVNLTTGTGTEDKVKAGYLNNPEFQQKIKTIGGIVDEFKPVIERNSCLENECHKKSWELLLYYGEYCKKHADLYYYMSALDIEKSDEAYDELMNWFSHNEDKFAQFFDFYVFTRRLNSVRYRAKDYAENLATKIQK